MDDAPTYSRLLLTETERRAINNLLAEIATLRSQVETHAAADKFFRKLCEYFWGDGGLEFEYCDFCDWGVELGLLTQETYDPANPEHVKIGEDFEDVPEEGDIFYRRAAAVLSKPGTE